MVNQTMQLVRDDAAMESIIAKVMELQNKENTNIPLYEKQLRDAESGIQNMLNAIQAGILTSSTKERLEQLEETKRELEARIAEEKLAKPKVTEEFIRFWLLRFRKLDMSLKDQRQALVDTFINAIYLYDDKVLITFNYKEGTQTVTFGEATEVASEGNGSDLDCFTALKTQHTLCAVFFFVRIRGLEQGGGAKHRKQSAQWAAAQAPTKETGVVWPNGFTTPVFCRRTTKTQPRFGEGEAKAGLYLNEGERKGKSGYRFSSNCSAVMVALPSAAKVMPSADWGV